MSLGTNSTRLLIVDVDAEGKLVERYHEAALTRLGEGLRERGPLLPAAVERTLEVVARYATRVRADRADTSAIATSAVRRAEDGERFQERFHAIAGVELRVLSGEEEARYSYTGATYGTQVHDRVAVLDIGGGSTECAEGRGDVERAVSVEIGAVRLTEMYPGLAGHDGVHAARSAAIDAAAYVSALFAERFAGFDPDAVMAVAGTPRTIGAILAKGRKGGVNESELAVDDVTTVLNQLLETELEDRRNIAGMTPQRADILAAGAIIYIAALNTLNVRSARITRNDLLLGFLSRFKS